MITAPPVNTAPSVDTPQIVRINHNVHHSFDKSLLPPIAQVRKLECLRKTSPRPINPKAIQLRSLAKRKRNGKNPPKAKRHAPQKPSLNNASHHRNPHHQTPLNLDPKRKSNNGSTKSSLPLDSAHADKSMNSSNKAALKSTVKPSPKSVPKSTQIAMQSPSTANY